MGSCQKCGAENPIDAQTCAMCGALLEPQRPANDALPSKKQRTSGFAIAALILGIASIIPVFMPFALVCGIIALVQIGNKQGLLRGQNEAKDGIACAIVLSLLGFGIFDPYILYDHGREKARQTQCISNQRQIALATNEYVTEHKGILPGKEELTPWSPDAAKQQWRTRDLHTYIPERFYNCISSSLTGASGPEADYAMNADIMGVKLKQIVVPAATLLTADTKGVDAIFSANEIDPRHRGGFTASFVDGHGQYFSCHDLPHDPMQTPLRTAADYTTIPPPAINKYIIQGATNVIEIKLHGWNGNPTCHVYSGKKLTTWIGKNGYLGTYISAYYSELPKTGVPRDITIGAFTNGPNGAPTRLVMPAAGGVSGVFATYWLPPVIGKSPAAGHPAYTGYRMTGGDGKGVSIVPVVL